MNSALDVIPDPNPDDFVPTKSSTLAGLASGVVVLLVVFVLLQIVAKKYRGRLVE